MAGKNIQVMVVDDSALMREIICDFINQTLGMEVIATAHDGLKALELLEGLKPDVITLDIQMPRLNGLETLERILLIRPTPVLMVSALTQLGATITLDALEGGALDYVPKPDAAIGGRAAFGEELVGKIFGVAGTDVRRVMEIRTQRKQRRRKKATSEPASKSTSVESDRIVANKCIALGISTGGPPALMTLFEALHPPLPPIVIVQHMPPQFTETLALRLNSLSRLTVKEAADGDVLLPNHAYVAPGGKHTSLCRAGGRVTIRVFEDEPVCGHRPSVDVMMNAAAKIFGNRCLGVIMTGMGRDGSDGCRAIRQAGGYVLGQDESSSDVYGMNKVAFTENNVDRQFSLSEAAVAFAMTTKRLWSKTPAVV